MTFAELAHNLLAEALTPDPRGIRTSQVGSSTFNPQLPEYKKIHPTGKSSAGNTISKNALRNIFRLLKNDPSFAGEVNSILQSYAKRQTVSAEHEQIIASHIGVIQDLETSLATYRRILAAHGTDYGKGPNKKYEGKVVLDDPQEVTGKIDDITLRIEKYREELDEVIKQVEHFPANNEALELKLRSRLISTVSDAASTMLEELGAGKESSDEVITLDQLDSVIMTDEDLEQQETKKLVLQSLIQDDPSKNALLRFFELQQRRYNEYIYNRKSSGRLATIEQGKQFNMLPLSVFERFYTSSVRDAGMIRLRPMTASAKALAAGFKGSHAGRSNAGKTLMALKKLVDKNFGSNSTSVQKQAFDLVHNSAAGPKTKQKLHSIVTDIISGVEGSPKRLSDIIYSNDGPITESAYKFNKLVAKFTKN